MYFIYLFRYILLLSPALQFTQGTVIFSTKPGREHPESGAKLNHGSTDVQFVDLTICWRFYEFPNSEFKYIISSMTKDKAGKESHIFGISSFWAGPKYTIWFDILGYSAMVNENWLAMEWNHVCFSFTNSTSNVRIVSNGQIVHDHRHNDTALLQDDRQ